MRNGEKMAKNTRGRRFFFGSLLILISYAGCKKNDFVGEQPTNLSPVTESLPAEAFVKQSTLATAVTNANLESSLSNTLSLNGRAGPGIFRFDFHFNSGRNTRIRLLSFSDIIENSSGCEVSPEKLTLTDGVNSEPAAFQTSMNNLKPETDYTLRIQLGHNCDSSSVKLTVNVSAWVGVASAEDPMVARLCKEDDGHQIAFFTINGLTGYSTRLAKQEFVGGNSNPCGLEDGATYTELTIRTGESLSSFGIYNAMEYSTKLTQPERLLDAKLLFNAAGDTGTLSCTEDGATKLSENLSDCQDVVLDRNLYDGNSH